MEARQARAASVSVDELSRREDSRPERLARREVAHTGLRERLDHMNAAIGPFLPLRTDTFGTEPDAIE